MRPARRRARKAWSIALHLWCMGGRWGQPLRRAHRHPAKRIGR